MVCNDLSLFLFVSSSTRPTLLIVINVILIIDLPCQRLGTHLTCLFVFCVHHATTTLLTCQKIQLAVPDIIKCICLPAVLFIVTLAIDF